MTRRNEAWQFRRRIVSAATRKLRPEGIGMRRPMPNETPLSSAEIFFGAQHGLIKLAPLNRRSA
jgi:hypothetical protein